MNIRALKVQNVGISVENVFKKCTKMIKNLKKIAVLMF